jgi:hypothetical protein
LKTILRRPRLLFFMTFLLVGLAFGQQTQTPAPPATPPPAQQTPPAAQGQDTTAPKTGDQAKDKSQTSGTSNDRLFFALPNFLTLENSAHVPPLTAGQKFKVVARGSFDPVIIVWYGALAGISQAENSEPGFGQGAEGYGKRFGSAFADGTIENFMVAAALPSLLHQDPRFFQLGHGGFIHRTGYAVSRIFITRSDSGHHQFNFSEIFGSAASAAISTYSYHPKSDRTVGNTASVWGTQVGYDSITFMIREFWPDIRRKMHKKENVPSGSPAP